MGRGQGHSCGPDAHRTVPATAEHGLTVVRRDRRGRGVARALKQAQLEWAAEAGVARLVTWTQKGNEAMQALNRSLGYVDRSKVITFRGRCRVIRLGPRLFSPREELTSWR